MRGCLGGDRHDFDATAGRAEDEDHECQTRGVQGDVGYYFVHCQIGAVGIFQGICSRVRQVGTADDFDVRVSGAVEVQLRGLAKAKLEKLKELVGFRLLVDSSYYILCQIWHLLLFVR